MRIRFAIIAGLAAAIFVAGCTGQPLSTREEGTLGGAGIGAGAGALGGAAVDAAREKKAERIAAADVALRAPSLEDVVKMTQSAVPANQIIDQIRTSGVVYRLTPDQLVWF